jgi:DNA-binding HxlR family transcriptional regulator
MKGYGQFCSIARAIDLLGERWMLLVVRELMCGSRTFGDVRRGIPRISRTMLSARLRALVDAGLVERSTEPIEYRLTAAGVDLERVVIELGTWGQRWLPRDLPDDELDLDALLWDMRRRVHVDALPRTPIVIAIELTAPRRVKPRWLLLRAAEVSVCSTNPGFPQALKVTTDLRTLTAWWRGDIGLEQARRGGLRVDGPRALVRELPRWFDRYLLADVRPALASGA